MGASQVEMTKMIKSTETAVSRRLFLQGSSRFLGPLALASLTNHADCATAAYASGFAGRAKRVIYLFMSGGPSHVDTFDPKPKMLAYDGQPIPKSIVDNVHFAMIDQQQRPLVKASPYRFKQHGQAGTLVSELLPHVSQVVDDICVCRSMRSAVFNHDPAVALLNTGDSRVGRPTMGAWLSYGLGTENENLPAYIVLTSGVKVQPLLKNYWTNGFLPSSHQGVMFRSGGDPVAFLRSAQHVSRTTRAEQIELIKSANAEHFREFNDPEILTRIKQYELAFRMQLEVPDLVDVSRESAETMQLYGAERERPSFARNCLLARRMVERGVRFVQLYDMGWDSHDNLQQNHERQCKAVDQGVSALILDLKRRGLLDETLVIWGGEFGRTPVAQGDSPDAWGRDHHPHGFTMFMAGGGIRGGQNYGETDEFGFHAQQKPLEVHDIHATVLHCMGIDHEKLSFRHQGRDFRLTDVAGRVIRELLV